MSAFTAIVYDELRATWERYDAPVAVLVAQRASDVLAVLQQVEDAAGRGLTAIGYVAYEAAGAFDPALASHAGSAPLARFGLYQSGTAIELPGRHTGALDLKPQMSRASYAAAFGAIRAYLAAGDTYQVNFTHQLSGPTAAAALDTFAFLVAQQPSRYATLLQWDGGAICSVTPELFFERNGAHLRTEPMKGTRPRGLTPAEDQRLHTALRTSAKERAENVMIVDMMRNDLGRIARPGSVRVDELFVIRQLPTVWQQVSSVCALTDASLLEVFTALFPCASVTGAPKRRAMQIIHELEPGPRGVYTGAIGWVKPGGRACFGVGIRTLVIDTQRRLASYGVGGGIVWDSTEEGEWLESFDKARVLGDPPAEFQLLETMKYVAGAGIVLLAEHLARLARSAACFGFEYNARAVADGLSNWRAAEDCVLRLLLHRDGQHQLEQRPLPAVQERVRLRLAVAPVSADDPFLRHKTTRRQVYDNARAQVADCDDVLLWNERGELTETSICNVLLDIDGRLLTPPLASGVLPGTYRQMLLDQGRAQESVLTPADLARAQHVWVCNSVRGLVAATVLA